MLNISDVRSILNDIKYLDWWCKVDYFEDSTNMYVQLKFKDSDSNIWESRKWYISPHMTKDEVVQTVLKAVLTAIEHEAREAFLYKGVAIFGPHQSIDDLMNVAESKRTK